MQRLFGVAFYAMVLTLVVTTAADASCLVAAPRCRCRSCCAAPATCCQYCTVMKTCCEVVYEEEECTAYRTVFQEVVEQKTVEAVKFEEVTQYRCQPTTVMQPCPTAQCGELPQACPPTQPCQTMVPVQVLKKVPYTALREVRYPKVEEQRRVLTKQVPYTFTRCVPKVVYKQVPVQVCCPMPCCGRSCCGDSAP